MHAPALNRVSSHPPRTCSPCTPTPCRTSPAWSSSTRWRTRTALPAALQAELGQRLGALALNRYPGDRVNDLRRALAAHAAVPEGFDLMLGNGSDELISLLAMACDLPGALASWRRCPAS